MSKTTIQVGHSQGFVHIALSDEAGGTTKHVKVPMDDAVVMANTILDHAHLARVAIHRDAARESVHA